jgi:hypothetical protein
VHRNALRRARPFALLAATACAFTAWLIVSKRIPQSGDQAIIALMARFIARGGGHPVFCWGSTYGGTLEAHVLAAAFALFGDTMRVFRAVMAVFYVAFGAGVVALSWRFFGREAALVSAAALALPPFFLPYKLLTSDGAYASVAILALAAVWICLSAGEEPALAGPLARHMAGLGFVAGLGLWVTPVTLPFSSAAVLWLLTRRPATGRLKSLLALGGGLAAGSAPSWIWNLRHGWASLRAREVAAASGGGLAANLRAFLDSSLPVLLGGARPNFQDDPHASFPGALVLMPLLVLLLLAPAAVAAFSDSRVRLLFLALGAQAAATLLAARFSRAEPRFLVAAYAVLPVLFGIALGRLPRGGVRTLWLSGLAVLLAGNASSASHARRHLEDRDDSQVTGPLEPLIAALDGMGATRVWANYATAYRVAFESGGRIVASPIAREDGVRDARADEEVRRAPDPAIVLLPPRDGCFRDFLAEEGLGVRERRAGPFAIFSGLPDSIRDEIRSAGTLPMPRSAYRVSWSGSDLPSAAAGGSRLAGRIRVTNEGPCTWMNSVSLLARWSGPEMRDERFPTPDRRVAPADGADLAFALAVPGAPGSYELRLDLEQYGIATFSSRGGVPFTREISVR